MNPEWLLQHFNRISEAPDAVPRLRRFILDLAVRGKLVEQNPNDEPAMELLKRIRAEKSRLEKNGIIRKPKPPSTIEGTETPFDVPSGWTWSRLGDSVNEHMGGGTPSKSNSSYWDGDIFWASVKDIGKAKYVDHTLDRITRSGLEHSSSNLIPPGNLIVVTRMGLGKLSINRVPIAINQDLRALFLSSLSSVDFYYIFFKTASYEGTGLTVKGIKVEELLNFPFPLPPLAEQHRIVAKVDVLMALCDELEAAQTKREKRRDRLVAATLHGLNNGDENGDPGIRPTFEESARFYFSHLPRLTTRPEHIQQLRQTILNLAIRGKLVPQDPREESADALLMRIQSAKIALRKEGKVIKAKALNPVSPESPRFATPQSWRWAKLGELSELITKGSSPKWQGIDYESEGNGILFITSENVGNYRLRKLNDLKYVDKRFNEIEPRSILKSNDILMNLVGASIGRTAIYDLLDGANINQAVALIRLAQETEGIFIEFLLHYLNSSYAIDSMLSSRVVTAQPNISLTDVREFGVPIPPYAEQHRIVAKVDELMALCDELESRIANTTATRHQFLEASLHEALSV